MNYKVVRIGLLNFWYFDDEEFDFLDGKLLLRGENGSGKSVTMQSFIPLILDGNRSSNRLDPFGSKEKRIEDYLLGPSDGEQQDDAIGYLYMELYQEEISKYVTVGMGLRARRGQPTDFWGFALKDGRRIGKDFILYKDYGQKVLMTKKELRARLGNQNEYTESSKDYKRIVNDLLFGFKDLDSYDEFINVLLQLRSPKLSKDYNPVKLTNILSGVLQPLTEDDVRPISEAIEDTNKTRERIESFQRHVKALGNLLKVYQNYNEIILYHKAQAMNEVQKSIKDKKDDIETKEGLFNSQKKRLVEVQKSLENLEKEFCSNEAKLEVNSNRDLQKSIADSQSLQETISSIQTEIEKINDKKDTLSSREVEKKISIKNRQNQIDRQERELFTICEEAVSLCDEIHCNEISSMFSGFMKNNEIDFEYLKNRISQYRTKLNQIKTQLEEKEKLEMSLNRLEEERLNRKKEYEENEKKLEMEKTSLKMQIDSFQDKIFQLEKSNQIVKLDEDVKKKIFSLINRYSSENYEEAKREYQDIAKHYEKDIYAKQNSITGKLRLEEQSLKTKREELEILKNSRELELEEEQEGIEGLKEKNIPFISFYKAIEFKEVISKEEQNRIEELLISMNVINAKIVPSTYLDSIQNIPMVFLKPGKKKENNLSHYFDVVENEFVSKDDIIAILESINIDGEKENYITPLKYQLDFIIGYSGTQYNSKYIGLMKRIKEQQRKIKEKEEEIEEIEKNVNHYQNMLSNISADLEKINSEFYLFPDNSELNSIESNIISLEAILKTLMDQDNKFCNQILAINKEIELLVVNLNKMKENIFIPLQLASYQEAIELIDKLRELFVELKSIYSDLERIKEQKMSDEISLSEIIEDIDAKMAELFEKEKLLSIQKSKKAAIDNILSNPDNKKLMEELKKIVERQKKIPTEKEQLNVEFGRLTQSSISLEESLTNDRKELDILLLELELRTFILEKEYQLHYVYSEEPLDSDKILKELKDRKDSNIQSSFENYIEAFNTYRLELSDYRLNTKEIFSNNEELFERYEEKGIPLEHLKAIMSTVRRSDFVSSYQGKVINIYELEECLKNAIIENESYISTQERHLFEDILLKTVGSKIRDRIESSKNWVSKMNEIMQNTQSESNLSFHLEWKSKMAFTEEELDTKELVRIFKIDAGQLTKEDSEKLIMHFRSCIKKELEYSDKTKESYSSIISRVLDYRNWFEFKLFYKRKVGEKKELTNKVFSVLSGGERAKSMYVPLFAAVYAKLLNARKDGLRLIALDEAFAGVDNINIREMFAILAQLNLDYILTSQALWGDYDTVKAMSICELIKDEAHKAVGIRHYHWNGNFMEMLES